MINSAKANATRSLVSIENLQGFFSFLALLILVTTRVKMITPKAIVFKRLYKPKFVSNNGLRMVKPPFMLLQYHRYQMSVIFPRIYLEIALFFLILE